MSRYHPDSMARKRQEARVIAHKQKVGTLIAEDYQLYLMMQLYVIPHKFSAPVTENDVLYNTPVWQMEKQRYMASLAAESLVVEQPSDTNICESTSIEDTERFEKICDIPAAPLVPVAVVEDLVVENTVEVQSCEVIQPVAILSSEKDKKTLWTSVRDAVFLPPTLDSVVEVASEKEEAKKIENEEFKQYKQPLIRQLIAPYLDCQTLFCMKRAYPTEDFKMKHCGANDVTSFLVSLPVNSDRTTVKAKTVKSCICTTSIYKAAFLEDLRAICYIHQVRKRLVSSTRKMVPRYWHTTRCDTTDELDTIIKRKGTDYHVCCRIGRSRTNKHVIKCFIRAASSQSDDWKLFSVFNRHG